MKSAFQNNIIKVQSLSPKGSYTNVKVVNAAVNVKTSGWLRNVSQELYVRQRTLISTLNHRNTRDSWQQSKYTR